MATYANATVAGGRVLLAEVLNVATPTIAKPAAEREYDICKFDPTVPPYWIDQCCQSVGNGSVKTLNFDDKLLPVYKYTFVFCDS